LMLCCDKPHQVAFPPGTGLAVSKGILSIGAHHV
jgi:hypothetical protein